MQALTVQAPPAPVPPPLTKDDVDRGANVQYTISRSRKPKRLGWLRWQPRPSSAADLHIDLLVLGDSWADDVDMAYECWPTKLARSRGWSCLSSARGGNRSDHAEEQYERAVAHAEKAGLHLSPSTVCVVHLGGNDMLQALIFFGPIALLLLLVDVLATLGLFGQLHSLMRFSYFGLLRRRLCARLGHLVRLMEQRRHAVVLVSGLPICSQVPTGRLLLSLLLGTWAWGWLCPDFSSRLVAQTIDRLTQLVQRELFESLSSALPADSATTLVLFDEADAVRIIAAEHAALSEQPGQPSAAKRFWRDGHHPCEWVHGEIARAASAALETVATPAAATRPSSSNDGGMSVVQCALLNRRGLKHRTSDPCACVEPEAARARHRMPAQLQQLSEQYKDGTQQLRGEEEQGACVIS